MLANRLLEGSVRSFSIFLISAVMLCAQGTASLRGTIWDPQKAAVERATVTLVQPEKGISRTVVSQKSGEYQFAQVPPGTYTVTVNAVGFSVTRNENVQLLVDTPLTLDIDLQMASSKATVDVVEEASAAINTTNATVGNTFQLKQVQGLPLQTRNVVELLSLQPGVTQSGETMGARRDQNNITLDGVDSNDNQNALSGLNGTTQNAGFNSALPVPLDSVMEFRVTVAGQDSTQGRSSGGQVSLVTRSGTNSLHGSAYEYNRNTAFTANYWFNNRDGLERPQLVRNQFGASLGGPVKKDRLFYFLNYERRIDSSATSVERMVPSESMKAGLIKVGLDDGTVRNLSVNDIKAIDPLHAGVNPSTLAIISGYPAGNDPSFGADGGLNFTGYRFNAPNKLDNRVYVGRIDSILDSQGRHTLSFRGTLSNQQQTLTPAQFAGQADASALFADNRGFSLRYTAALTPNVVNIATVGLTRVGYSNSGTEGTAFTLGDITSQFNYGARPFLRINPVWNAADDLTWTKGSHTLAMGFNFRNIDNGLISYGNSYPSYSFSRGILVGLGADINSATASYLGGATLANRAANTNAFGALLGLVDSSSVTYQYDKSGAAIPLGQPSKYDFISRTYEGYIQDTWKASKKLTLTLGLRYSYGTPPFEASGLQVGSVPGIDEYFARRVYAADHGIPANQLPGGDRITFNLNGPANGRSSWYKADRNNFAPRLAVAYSPTSKTVIRAGAAMLYDQYGNDLASNISTLGSAGLATTLGFSQSYDFTTSPRYNGTFPALTPAPAGGFPFTPPDIASISGTLYGINPNLVAPYSYVLNFNVTHDLGKGYSLDIGYVGRLSHKLLAQQDMLSPLITFKDPKSGQSWIDAGTAYRALYGNGKGLTSDQAQANPASVPKSSFVENMFPGLKDYYFPGSASANYYYGIYGEYGGSDLDNLHSLDRLGAPDCITVTGCYTFFAPQGSADPTWTNAANANYHGMVVTLRHAFNRGFSFDLNYTWSHAIDNVSSPTDNSGQFGGDIQNAFAPGQARASSDFDIRHQFNANVVYSLPFGRGQKFLSGGKGWVNEIVGGWQIASLVRVQSGLPTLITGDEVYPTNYWQNAVAVPNGPSPKTGVYADESGNPSLFHTLDAIGAYQDAWPGQSGMRAIVRLPGQKNVDIAVMKSFAMPWEGHQLQFRAEAFNAFNFVNFGYGALNTSSTSGQYSTGITNLALTSPTTFGEFTGTTDPRVFQLSLRYSF